MPAAVTVSTSPGFGSVSLATTDVVTLRSSSVVAKSGLAVGDWSQITVTKEAIGKHPIVIVGDRYGKLCVAPASQRCGKGELLV